MPSNLYTKEGEAMQPVPGGESGEPGNGGQAGLITEQVKPAEENRTVLGYQKDGGST
jgi:hypothetical protein